MDRKDGSPPTDENALIAERRAKLARLREAGVAFPNDFRRDALAADLHAIPPEEAPMLKLVTPEGRMARERPCYDVVMPVLKEHFSPEEYALAEAWWDRYLNDERLLSYEPRVTHGDLWWANFLVDESGSRLLSVLDWGSMIM